MVLYLIFKKKIKMGLEKQLLDCFWYLPNQKEKVQGNDIHITLDFKSHNSVKGLKCIGTKENTK